MTYFNLTKNLPPHKLTVKAFKYVKHKGLSLDLGAGALRDTNFLRKHFKVVISVDKNPYDNTIIKANFKDFKFQKYDFINAQYSLPFLKPKDFKKVWSKLIPSLNGVFCGTFFGIDDDWANKKNMTFHKEVKSLFKNMKILHYKEIKKQHILANGSPHFWHIFNVIAKH